MLRDPKPLLSALLTALVCFLLILGGFSLSLAEGARSLILPSPYPTATLASLWSPSPTPLPFIPSPLPSPTLLPSPATCPPPAGWMPLAVQAGQTLAALAQQYHTSVQALMQANCLLTQTLVPGTVLYVPPVPTSTLPPCGPPRGWIPYTVQPGDTLYSLAKYYGVTVAQLQQANCLGASTLIVVGQVIYVPNLPTRTPSPGPTLTLTPTLPVPTETATPSFTCTPSPTGTFTDTPVVDPAP
jgi:LysM repeat protein